MPKLTPLEYETLVEQAPIMVWRSDTSAECDYFNDRWLTFRGRLMHEELGNGWASGVHPDDYERCLDTYRKAFAARQVFEMEYRLRRFDGEYRWIFDRGVPFFEPGGTFAGFIGSCIDITEQVELRMRLHELREAELKQLRGMLPICAWCKNVRGDDGYWQAVDQYISSHADVDLSHTICPACDEKLRRETRQRRGE